MTSSNDLALVVFLLAIILLVAPPPVSSDMAYLKKICAETRHNDVCLAMFHSVSGGVNCANLTCAAGDGAGAAVRYAKNTSSFIDNLMRRDEYQALGLCATLFATVEKDLDAVTLQIYLEEYPSALKTVRGTLDNPDKCEGALRSHPNPLTSSNKRMGEILDVLLVFLDKIAAS